MFRVQSWWNVVNRQSEHMFCDEFWLCDADVLLSAGGIPLYPACIDATQLGGSVNPRPTQSKTIHKVQGMCKHYISYEDLDKDLG
jgi:hypothetical protein